MFMGSTVAALAEALALAKAAGVEQEMVIDVIGSGALNAPIFKIKACLFSSMMSLDYEQVCTCPSISAYLTCCSCRRC